MIIINYAYAQMMNDFSDGSRGDTWKYIIDAVLRWKMTSFIYI